MKTILFIIVMLSSAVVYSDVKQLDIKWISSLEDDRFDLNFRMNNSRIGIVFQDSETGKTCIKIDSCFYEIIGVNHHDDCPCKKLTNPGS